MEFALFLHAEDSIASTERTALQIVGIAGCAIGFCAPQGGGGQAAYASLVDLRTGEVAWFNILQTSSLLPGVRFGDLRTPEGAEQMVERLIGRIRAGRHVRADVGSPRPGPRRRNDPRFTRRALLAGLGCACCAGLLPATAGARVRPADMQSLIGPGYRPTDKDERGMWQQYEGSRRRLPAPTCCSATRRSIPISAD